MDQKLHVYHRVRQPTPALTEEQEVDQFVKGDMLDDVAMHIVQGVREFVTEKFPDLDDEAHEEKCDEIKDRFYALICEEEGWVKPETPTQPLERISCSECGGSRITVSGNDVFIEFDAEAQTWRLDPASPLDDICVYCSDCEDQVDGYEFKEIKG